MQATVDALGHPTGFLLTPGPACDWEGADALRPALEAPIVMADKGYDADQRVLPPLAPAGKTALIPPRRIAKQSVLTIKTSTQHATGSRTSFAT
jgi:transposase